MRFDLQMALLHMLVSTQILLSTVYYAYEEVCHIVVDWEVRRHTRRIAVEEAILCQTLSCVVYFMSDIHASIGMNSEVVAVGDILHYIPGWEEARSCSADCTLISMTRGKLDR